MLFEKNNQLINKNTIVKSDSLYTSQNIEQRVSNDRFKNIAMIVGTIGVAFLVGYISSH